MTSYAEAFRASQSAKVEQERALQKLQNLVSGFNSSEPYAWYDQSTSSWKTYQRSLVTDWTSFSGTFTRQGFMNVNGQLFQQAILEQHTNVTDGICSEYLPTPTTMDIKPDALKHATKLLQGKTHRASGQPIQKTLSDKVMMNLIKENPELMKIFQDHQMEERPHLPTQEEFVAYLRKQTTIKKLTAKTTIKKTTIEHWFRKDKAGFSYPSIENWEEIKPHLKTIQFDMEMTTVKTKEWTTKSPMLPTPTASDVEGGVAKDVQYKNGSFFRKNKQGVRWGVKLRDAVSIITDGEIQNTDLTQTGKNMVLNPQFTEILMGFPLDWTKIEATH